jgi:hypothetical protein
VAPFTWSVAPGSNLPPGTAIVHGNGVVSDIIAGKPTTPGTYSFTLNVVDGAGQMASTTIGNVQVTSLAISPLRLPTGVVGTPYNAALTQSGGTPPYGPMQLVEGSSISPGLTFSAAGVFSGTPTAPGNYLLGAVYTDSLSMGFQFYRLTIDNAAGEAKAVSLSPSAIEVSRPLGAPTAGIPLQIKITNGQPAFTTVISGIPGATISTTPGATPGVLADLIVNLPTETLAQGVYHGMVGVKVNGTANVDEVAPILVTIGPPPVVQALTATPNNGSGIHQIFSLTYSDSVGATADLQGAFVQFTNVANPALLCRIQHRATVGQVRLLGDDGLTWGPFTSYGAGTLQNSQCSLNLATSTATPSGNDLTLSLDITFKPAFAGPATLAMRAQSVVPSQNTGFLAKGTFTVGGAVLDGVSITPNTGTGVTQTFSAVFTDSLGVTTDLLRARVRFGPNGVGTCVVDYDAIANKVRMLDDTGAAGGFVNLGVGVLQNSQCSLDLAASTAVPSGTTLTLNLKYTFKASFLGAHPVSLRAVSNFGTDTGWLARGTWTVGATVQALAITPVNGSSAADAAQTFVLTFSDSAGVAADLIAARVRFRVLSTGLQCNISYNAVLDQVRIVDDTGIAGPFTSFGAGTLFNSQCILDLASSNAVRSGNDLTLTLRFTFKPAFANSLVGPKDVAMLATSSVGPTTNWVSKGSWTVTP